MNVYQMYKANGYKFGFFIVRGSWGHTIAKVTSIEGVTEGDRIKGSSPYRENKKVYADFFKTTSPKLCDEGTFSNSNEVSCPGSYAYSMVPLVETGSVHVKVPFGINCDSLRLPVKLKVKCPSCQKEQKVSMMNSYFENPSINEFEEIQSLCSGCGNDYSIRAKMKVEIIYQTEGISSK